MTDTNYCFNLINETNIITFNKNQTINYNKILTVLLFHFTPYVLIFKNKVCGALIVFMVELSRKYGFRYS
jgi:hypothetical protein